MYHNPAKLGACLGFIDVLGNLKNRKKSNATPLLGGTA
jgi:hypothetical protein